MQMGKECTNRLRHASAMRHFKFAVLPVQPFKVFHALTRVVLAHKIMDSSPAPSTRYGDAKTMSHSNALVQPRRGRCVTVFLLQLPFYHDLTITVRYLGTGSACKYQILDVHLLNYTIRHNRLVD
jgi:hypothetical protein